MKFYRVSYSTVNQHSGYTWHASKTDALKTAAKFRRENAGPVPEYLDEYSLIDNDPQTQIEVFDVAPTKTGILALLHRVATHEQNG